MATASYVYFGISVPLTVVVNRMSAGMSDLILLAIPLFVLLGLLIEATGVARALLAFVSSMIGHVRGGFAYVLLVAMYLVSGISGSKTADMAAVAPGLLPELEKSGMPRSELAALMASSAAMSETIPPSLVLIVLGASTGISIASLFTAGLLPAAVCAIALVIVAWRRTRSATVAARASWVEMGRAFAVSTPALALPLLIRFCVTEGVATATEVATIGIVYTLLIGSFVYTSIDGRKLFSILLYTASLSGVVFMILGMGTAMAWALTRSGFAQDLLTVLNHMPGGASGFLVGSIIGFIVLGSVLEGLPAILVFGPLTLPLARAVGIHDVHYAMVIIIAMGIGLFAPPFGTGYYAACVISGVSPDAAMRRIWPYLAAVLAALFIVAFVPWLSTGLLER
jgi:tripartite ATP-independent transporter DctM subunit